MRKISKNKKKNIILNKIDNNSSELFILSEIGDSYWNDEVSLKDFKSQLDEVEDTELTIYINSPGGSVFEGNAIANLIKSRKGTTKCVISALCASIATQIALSCDEVSMYKNGMFMIHCASGGFWGNADEIEKKISLLRAIDSTLSDTYANKTGLTEAKCLEYMKAESWFNSKDALELGFIDSIIEDDLKATAKAELGKESISRYKNAPKNFIKFLEEDKKEEEGMELLQARLKLALL